jgi:geranylgeranyl diphosphate synthase type II
MYSIEQLRDEVNKAIEGLALNGRPAELYAPIKYIMSLGGKRIRPVLVLTACEMFGEDYRKAIPAALSVEVFHNFTLVHDDIMDMAPLRRGKQTVHKKWNQNIAILSGDTMLSLSHDLLLDIEKADIKKILKVFNRTSIEVCEGQQYDMNFENEDDVSISAYLEMIKLKTAVLLGSCLQIGAMIGGANDSDHNNLYDFGINIGLAFQLRDDLLDVYGDSDKFGKQDSGDIVTNKKTYLYLKALEKAGDHEKALLKKLYQTNPSDPAGKIKTVKGIFDNLSIKEETEGIITEYYQKAIGLLNDISVSEERKQILRAFAKKIVVRDY